MPAQQGSGQPLAQSDEGRNWLQTIGAINGIFQMGTEIAVNGPKPKYTGPTSWANQIKAGKNFTKKLGMFGMGVTVADAAIKGEWQPHHG